MSRITLEFANFIEFFEFIRKTHEFIDAVGNRIKLEELIEMTKEEILAKVEAVKVAVTDAVTKETQDVKDLIIAKLTGVVSAADLEEIGAALDGLGASIATSIDTISDNNADHV